jgi:RpiB/LacA/LacB family sugar-phosphate isomerase
VRVYAASDHAGFPLKKVLVAEARRLGHEVIDLGPENEDRVDYPDYGAKVGRAVAQEPGARGLLVCGSGIGISIAANKIPGIRATVVWDETSARLSREHNDTNVVAFGGRLTDAEVAKKMLDVWLSTPFEGGRHADRIQKIHDLERA